MKRMRLLLTGLTYFLFIGLCLSPITFVSCDDENEGIELGNYLNGTYVPGNEKNLLSATIDGETVSGDASATFHSGDLKTGSITLNNVIKGYSSIVIDNLPLTEVTEDDYTRLTFSGEKTVDDTFSFSYSGYIVYGNLYMDISTH